MNQTTANKNIEVNETPDDTWDHIVETFDEMNLKENLLRGIYSYGYDRPSQIQQRGIGAVVSGRDTIAQAQSGTGKTGTFSISALQRLDENINECQVLILAPTRELADQTFNVTSSLGKYMGITAHACMGGTNVREDIEILQSGRQLIVGTPGRILHMVSQGFLNVSLLKMFILDEADEMLSRGFKEQIYEIFQFVPTDVQVALFSATMPGDILKLTDLFMRNPIRILVKKDKVTLDGIKQFYIAVEEEQFKVATILDLYSQLTISKAIIFCNTRHKVEWLTDQMTQNDFSVSAIHGQLTSQQRNLLIKEFHAGATRVLISTDLLARGIDDYEVSLVINYDLPINKECYIHRIGRSGRFGRKGTAINFVTNEDAWRMDEIESFYSTKFTELPQDLSLM